MKSLELNWLCRKLRHVYKPKVVFLDKITYWSGCYVCPGKVPYMLDEVEYDTDKGIIFVADTEDTAATLAHEFRHHWQFVMFGEKANDNYITWDSLKGTWEDKIKQYYNKNTVEHDALMFECMVAPCEYNLYCRDRLI